MTFNELGLIEPILRSITVAKYEKPTPIQEKAIPVLLSGKDMLGSAQTGTGKTAAFAIPIIQQLFLKKDLIDRNVIKALVLTPTRELANQIAENFTLYAKHLKLRSAVVYGGVSQKKQVESIKRGVDILIATPGRLLDLMSQEIISLSDVSHLVLDEADQMLDMGFIKDVHKIISKIPKNRQTMLFSATMPPEIEKLAQELLQDPVRVAVAPVTKTLDAIKQSLYYVPRKEKTNLLMHLITEKNMKSVLVFTRTKSNANKVLKDLLTKGFKAEAIHGNKSQLARETALDNFKRGKTKILVATDIAARGIDIDKLSYVVNHNLPEIPETYIHRIGRTGRAGEVGESISFCDELEIKLLQQIEKHIKQSIDVVHQQPYRLEIVSQSVPSREKPLSQISKKNKNSIKKNSFNQGFKSRTRRPGNNRLKSKSKSK